jgi:hypothetical protein
LTVWLFVERLENWRVDLSEGFSRFGLPAAAAKRAVEIDVGDLLVFYVSSGVSSLADIRVATHAGTEKLKFGGDYDTAYPFAIRTQPFLTLPRPEWLPMREICESISIFAGKDWRQMMRTTIRKLNQSDGETLVRAMRARAKPE